MIIPLNAAPPHPLHSFLGGLGMPLSIQSLMLLNGQVLGISGFIHRGIRGTKDGLAGMSGLIIGGAFVGLIDYSAPVAVGIGLPKLIAAGLCVGLGSKMANGCTSGHMLAGVSRCSLRSVVATATFVGVGAITAHLFHSDLPSTPALNWTLTLTARNLLLLQGVPFIASAFLYFINADPPEDKGQGYPYRPNLRLLAHLVTTIQFALSLHLSELTNPHRVISFLLLPFHKAWDPSLVFLAGGALPLAMLLYHYGRGNEQPRLGGPWTIPKRRTRIDRQLLTGSALFGIGWGLAGICPGPGLVNFGRLLTGRASATVLCETVAWLGSMTVGGLLA